MTILTPPKALREKLGEDGVDALIDLVNKANEKQKEDILVFVGEKFEGKVEALEERFDVKLESLAERFDVKLESLAERFDVKLESLAGRIDAKLEVVEEKFERRLAEEIAKVRVDLGDKITGIRSEIIKWMFIFWVGQIAVLTGLMLAFFK